jgi:streptomycin 6-kinase
MMAATQVFAQRELADRWALTIGEPYAGGTCAWVAPVTLADGSSAVLKLSFPHMEAAHEIEGLRFWNGDPTVHLLASDDEMNAMLLERCDPGTPLRTLPEDEQDRVLAGLLHRLWRLPPAPHPFRPLSEMTAYWSDGRDGRVFEELLRTTSTVVLLATDLHAGNVLRAEREPWLVIDPKPFIGDPAYDATQHLFNCTETLRADPLGRIHRFADLLGVDRERVRLWMFARAATEQRDDWTWLARALAP